MLLWLLAHTYLFQAPFPGLLVLHLEAELLGHMVILNFLRNCQVIFYSRDAVFTLSLATSLDAFFLTDLPALTTTQYIVYFIYIPH